MRAAASHKLCQRNLCERIHPFQCAGEIQVPCHGPWCDDAADAGGHGGAETVEGVFEDNRLLGYDAEFFSGVEEEARVGLHLASVIDGGDVVKMSVQAELIHPGVDPYARAAAGDGDAQAERGGFLQTVRHAGQQLQVLAQFTLAGLAFDFDRVPVEHKTRELFEITPWIVAAGDEVAANSLCIALQRQIMAMLVKDFPPGEVTGAFSVNDEAVEVEDDGADGWGHADGLPRVAKDAKDSKAVKTGGPIFYAFSFQQTHRPWQRGITMLSLKPPARERLHELLEAWKDESLSYTPPLRDGFIADEHEVRLGSGAEVYQAACAALDAWVMFPTWAEVGRLEAKGQKVGQIVAMVTRICGLWWSNPCRILRRCDSANTHGFVYGTLPEHTECGEEQFVIEHRADGSVWYAIRAFSHPRHWMAWLGFPLARWWQCRFVRDSQARMQEAVV